MVLFQLLEARQIIGEIFGTCFREKGQFPTSIFFSFRFFFFGRNCQVVIFFVNLYLFVLPCGLQDKHALEKRVSNMEEELKVKAWAANRLLCPQDVSFSFSAWLRCSTAYLKAPGEPLACAASRRIQRRRHCWLNSAKHTKHRALGGGSARPGGVFGMKEREGHWLRGSLHRSVVGFRAGPLPAQAEEEPAPPPPPPLSCSTSPTVGVNTVT